MARTSYALLVAILVTITLLDCFTECGAAKNKQMRKPAPAKKGDSSKRQKESPKDVDASDCAFEEKLNLVCGSDKRLYWNAKSLECGKKFDKDLKEAKQSNCPTFPKNDQDKKKVEEMWRKTLKERTGAEKKPAAGSAKRKNKG